MKRVLPFALLALLGLVVLFDGDLAARVAGYRPLRDLDPTELDEPTSFDERAAPRFFAERDEVEIEVPRDLTVGELLRLYRVDFPHVRRQVAEQMGLAADQALADDVLLRRGERYRITLTPPAEGEP